MGMLAEDAIRKYQRAGEIATKVREEMKKTTRESMPIVQICEKAEKLIKKLGGKPAFPCNVSVNEVAAHYTSPPGDEKKVAEGSLVKIDIGVHVDGYIADTATTVCFNSEHEDMVRTAEEALEAAIRTIRPGLHTSQLGSEIQRVIEREGFKPISNLTGHQMGRFMVHTGKSLPNISHLSMNRIREGDVYAVEPFVTVKDAVGRVEDGPEAYIFRFVKRRPVEHADARELLRFVEAEFRTLPFAERWLTEYGSRQQCQSALSQLLESRCLMSYPIFVEISRKPIAQSEHTVRVDKEGAIVLT